MNLESNYENLTKAKETLEELINSGVYDPATIARLNNVSSRIKMTLINMRIAKGE